MDANEQPRKDLPAIPAEALDVALADVENGRVVPGEEVLAWLASWGSPDERPMPKIPEIAARPWR